MASGTWAAMFEPEKYPPPPLSGTAVAWRYAVAIATYFFMSAMWLLTLQAHQTGVLFEVPITIEEFGEAPPLWFIALDPVLGLAGLGVIHLRRRYPLWVALGTQLAGFACATGAAVTVWALVANASRRNLRNTLLVGVVSVGLALASSLLPWSVAFNWRMLVLAVVVTTAFSLWGMCVGVRRDRQASFLRRVEQADADRAFAVLAERNRIAREMHDVLAHRISLVSMHAGVLAYRPDLPPEKTREIAGIIQENAHASLTELRSVLSTLRAVPPHDETGTTIEVQTTAAGGVVAPQPTLADLADLVQEVRRSGQRLSVADTLDAASVPLVQQRHLYRIVQECLTNARKHAPRAAIDLVLSGSRRDGITVSVTNDLTAVTAAIPGAKLGLVGITERAEMLGGRLGAGVQGGRFHVEAWLPWDDDFRRRPNP